MRSVELFAGAGGLSLGTSRAGFEHLAVLEWNKHACETVRVNQGLGVEHVANWPLHEGDVRHFDYAHLPEGIELVAGGPPCQPFSLGGKHRAHSDNRDMFPEAIRAIRELRPKAFIFENVKGLLRQSFSTYFEYILLQLTYPEIVRRNGEDWLDHLQRLERQRTAGRTDGLSYNVVFRLLNAADYGVPQRRERVFMVGFRSDLNVEWTFPNPTHSREALLFSQAVSGDYWERHGIPSAYRAHFSKADRTRIERMGNELFPPVGQPWLTIRDTISDLPIPSRGGGSGVPENHKANPGARVYKGHTGSPLDLPAKTLKAGDHGVPGGENMLVHPNGRVRYFTIRESARLQTFPDDYVFLGSWTESMRQLGNAVPVRLGEVVASGVGEILEEQLRGGAQAEG